MKECEATKLIAMSAKILVKRQIKGEVFWHIVNDTLVVDIFGVNDIVFRFTMECLSRAIVQGLTGQKLASCIIVEYKKYINFLFFK